MKKTWIYLMVIALCLFLTGVVLAQEDIKKHPSCQFCGMDREKFAHSRIYIEFDDGSTDGACSLHCAAIDLAIHIDKTPKTIWVGDYHTKMLIDAEKGFWPIGGSKMGVMTQRAKWAFAKKEEAEKFKTENGGDLGTFDQAIKAAYEDMYLDTKMIREKRKMMKKKPMEHK
jgi:hypothetical protein